MTEHRLFIVYRKDLEGSIIWNTICFKLTADIGDKKFWPRIKILGKDKNSGR